MNNNPELTAIDILLNPDENIVERAVEINKRLLEEYPLGFKLDESHIPHISILHCYVRTKDLEKVYSVVENVIKSENVTSLQLTAVKIEYKASSDLTGIASIIISPVDILLNFQTKLIDALKPYMENNITTADYVTSDEESNNNSTLKYVENFIPDHSGNNFTPHITVGINNLESPKKLVNEPFIPLKFSPVSIAIYLIGNNGTVSKVLKEWTISRTSQRILENIKKSYIK
ncbi:MAG: hypothetical protein ACLPWD_00970 [Methanobacterium sp.]